MDLIVDFPSREEIEALAVGDMAIDCWGRLSRVDEISYRGVDVNGFAFVGYYTDHGDQTNGKSRTSMSRKESQITRTVALSNRYLSRDLDDLEAKLQRERGVTGSLPVR